MHLQASLDLLKAKQEQLAQAPAKADVDSDEELYRFFEEPEERKEKKGGSRHRNQTPISTARNVFAVNGI